MCRWLGALILLVGCFRGGFDGRHHRPGTGELLDADGGAGGDIGASDGAVAGDGATAGDDVPSDSTSDADNVSPSDDITPPSPFLALASGQSPPIVLGPVVPGGATQADLTIVANDGAVTLGTLDSASTGLAAPFSLTANTCTSGGVLAKDTSCTVTVTFNPTDAGSFGDTASVAYTTPAGPAVIDIALSGSAATSQSQSLEAGEDGEIMSMSGSYAPWVVYPDGKNGDGILHCGAYTYQHRWCFFRFALTGAIPAGVTIQDSTTLSLEFHSSDGWSTSQDALFIVATDATDPAEPTLGADHPDNMSNVNLLDDPGFEVGIADFGAPNNGGSVVAHETANPISGSGSLKVELATYDTFEWKTAFPDWGLGPAEGFDVHWKARTESAPGGTVPVQVCANVVHPTNIQTTGCRLLDGPVGVVTDYSIHVDLDPSWIIQAPRIRIGSPNGAAPHYVLDDLSFVVQRSRPQHRPTDASVRWPPSGGFSASSGSVTESPSLASVIQELVTKHSGLAAGTHIVLWVSGVRDNVNADYDIADTAYGGLPAQLTIDWAP